MQETKIFEYYAFGYDYFLLRYKCKGISVHGSGNTLISRINNFLLKLKELDLQVTQKASEKLRDIRERAQKLPKDAKVDASLAGEITTVINNLDVTLDAELNLRSAYIVTPKRFHLDHLLKTPENLFANLVFEDLPAISRFDFSQACRAIAFGLPTAAVFHLMRGTEGVLRHYYTSIVRRGRKSLMWNNMIEHLKSRRAAPSKPLIDNLNNIRVNYRNPTQHPDARYDMDEAQDLLAISTDVVNRMIKDLWKRKKR